MTKQRRFAISDIHGGYKALLEVLKAANLDYENDKLIVIGDVFDGWPEIRECFDELLKIKNLVYILGNHDEWSMLYFRNGREPAGWYGQGGHATIEAFGDNLPIEIMLLISKAPTYYIEDNMLFVHGGFDTKSPIENQHKDDLIWSRRLMDVAMHKQTMADKHGHPAKVSEYDKVFIGHTPTLNFGNTMTPIKNCEVYLIDTGASYDGPLTLVDIDTEEYWQSKPVMEYYPGIQARGHYKY